MPEINSIGPSRFLNLIVEKILPGTLMQFTKAWLKQECKDFRIIFNKADLNDVQKTEIELAREFASAFDLSECIVVIDGDQSIIPDAKVTKILKDTSVMPLDKLEVLKLKSKNQHQTAIKKQEAQVKNEPESTNEQTEKPTEKSIEKTVEKKADKPIEILNHIVEIKPTPKIVCYTCITNQYDVLKPLSYQHQSIDLVCFTDNKDINSNGWILKDIPDDLKHLSKVKQQRILKIHPQKYLSEYDISLWIDGNFVINCDIEKDFFAKI